MRDAFYLDLDSDRDYSDDRYFRRHYGEIMSPRRPTINRDWNTPLPLNPHYTDPRFDTEQTVWGSAKGCAFYNYSDRLWQADHDKSRRAVDAANACGAVRFSARWVVCYLSAWHGVPVTLMHVMAGVNKSNGYGYAIYGYTYEGGGNNGDKGCGR